MMTACSSERIVSQPAQVNIKENAHAPVSMTGGLSCARARSGYVFNILLEDSNTKDSIKLVDYGDDLASLCARTNARVRIVGAMTPRFLFWGGNLSVKSFAVARE